MKKLLSLATAVTLLLSLAACGAGGARKFRNSRTGPRRSAMPSSVGPGPTAPSTGRSLGA